MMMIASNSIRHGPISFNLYTRDSEDHMVLFCRKGVPIQDEHMNILSRTNRVFYISGDDMDAYLDYSFERLDSLISESDVQVREKTRLLQDIGKKVINNLMSNPRSGEAIHHCQRFVKSTVELLLSEPESSMLLLEMTAENSYLLTHSISTCIFSLLIGCRIYGDDRGILFILGQGGLLLDVGMTKVNKSILFKRGSLTDEEWQEIQSHPERGLRLTSDHNLPSEVSEIVLKHHERLDGSGYPHGLQSDDIPTHVRIASVADVYDALTTDRGYRGAQAHLKALRIMSKQTTLFDADVFDALLHVVLQENALIEKFTFKEKGTI